MMIEETAEKNRILFLDYNLILHKKRLDLIKKNKLLGQEYIISLVSICSRELL